MDGCGWAMCSKDVYFCFDRGILLLAAGLPCTELVELMRCNGAVAPVGDMCRQFVFLQKPMFFSGNTWVGFYVGSVLFTPLELN